VSVFESKCLIQQTTSHGYGTQCWWSLVSMG
jgi:hypothetical protein